MNSVKELSPLSLASFTQIDYSREMALIAVTEGQDNETQLGVARYATNPDGESCEFAIVVADNMRSKGLGQLLMLALMVVARAKGLKVMEGKVLNNNANMLNLMERLNFTVTTCPEDSNLKTVRIAL